MENKENQVNLLIANASLQGSESFSIAKLERYDKKRHQLPQEANDYTNAFLARLVEQELDALGEDFFKRFKEALNYKRKDISLSVSSPCALLEAKDFKFEINYEVDEESPAFYNVTYKLFAIENDELLTEPAFNDVLTNAFDSIVFEFKKLLSIVDIIDAIEADESDLLTVDYPSSCAECEIQVRDQSAEIHCSGALMTVIFDSKQAPLETQACFAQLQDAFSKVAELSHLLQ